MELIRITFECENCTGTVLETDDKPTNDSIVRCKGCGWVYGTFRDLKRNAVDEALGFALTTAVERIKKRSREFN